MESKEKISKEAVDEFIKEIAKLYSKYISPK